MKRTFILAAAALASSFNNGEPMKLVNTKTGYVVVEFSNGKVSFNDRFLEVEMKETGILIPPMLLHEFAGKDVIYFGDSLFEKAFVEVYYPFCIAHSLYQWQQ
ncbi:MAG: hypothetical protein V4487_00740 [Chlamydiota bacterium]